MAITYENTLQIAEEVAPLVLPDKDEASAVRFDALIYTQQFSITMDRMKQASSVKQMMSFYNNVKNYVNSDTHSFAALKKWNQFGIMNL